MIYSHYCQKCKKETAHRIFIIQRNKGVKLECMRCGKKTLRYYNVHSLKKINLRDLKGEKN